jgi:ferric-dicitrate binding protein FerR (iron transport regulator)
MKQNKDNTSRMDVDKAWETLYTRLEKEQLLTGEIAYSSNRRRKIPLQWMTVAAAICAGFIFSIFYFSQNKDQSMLFLQNMDSSGTLVAIFDDGSTVYLASNATISYPSVFATSQRKVELSGNALFCIAKDENRPFVIEMNEITIEVVGTIFAIQSSPENPFELSVKQGKVNIYSKDEQTGFPVEAGEEIVRLSTGELKKSKITNSQLFNLFTSKMCFKDEKLNNIIHVINTIYGSPVVIADESLNNRTLTVTFENNSVESMTELICMGLDLKQTIEQDTIYIRQPQK